MANRPPKVKAQRPLLTMMKSTHLIFQDMRVKVNQGLFRNLARDKLPEC
jgi:hypothetical protein